MYSQRAIERVRVIDKKIGFIENIIRTHGSIIHALED